MAQPHQPRHHARHASSARSLALSDLAALVRGSRSRVGSTVAKVSSVGAAGGLAVALVVPGQSAAASATPVETSADQASADLAASLLDQRAESRVSRSVSRASLAPAVALEAPAAAAPVAAPTFGAMSFTAVEKPEPPPPPAPAGPSRESSGGSTGGSDSGGSSSGGSSSAPAPSGGGGYDWAAANACSCAQGLTQNAMGVLAAVKASFPGMTNIGGVRPDSMPDHPSGRALDFMTSDRGYGDAIANMLISRAGELNIEYIIWRQRVWLPSSGWRTMEDRGSATANHYDHVHVTVR
ncbi:hypothetical protein GA707_17680 [Nostocoides sp. F2B08]|uniref:hypothetical protein n=1 Tax=Nostocoides sp. F2B08 TaxID=2653936 RepID=UPI001263D064|nr:hypothetical protein [Tetrasphaera sp. F2B08]KAB7741381.1 hypothetical protein GA707_17680 [Tetrasphaera sp. F2B08]